MDANQKLLTFFAFLGYAVKFILILIPIILIVFGIIDLVKCLVDPNNKASLNLFIKRLLYGVGAFFLVFLVTFIFNMMDVNINNKYFKCFNNPNLCNNIIKSKNKKTACSTSDDKDKCCKLLINNDAKYNEVAEDCVIPISKLMN